MIHHYASLLEKYPALGWVGSAIAALPPWLTDTAEVIKILGLVVGVVAGTFTAMIQARAWWRDRRGN